MWLKPTGQTDRCVVSWLAWETKSCVSFLILACTHVTSEACMPVPPGLRTLTHPSQARQTHSIIWFLFTSLRCHTMAASFLPLHKQAWTNLAARPW